MKTTIIVATYNRPQLVERMLTSLAKCTFPSDAEVEVLVVENGKVAGTEQVCNQHTVGGRVRYMYVGAPGKSNALNAAMRACDADLIIFFDDDLTFSEQIVGEYVAAARRYGPGYFFGGPLLADAEVPCPAYLAPHLPSSSLDWSLGEAEIEIDNSHATLFFGANWAAFKSDIIRAGAFSEEIGVSPSAMSPVGEETELQRALFRAGMRAIYLPRALIHHLVAASCYTVAWARDRKARHGVTYYLLNHKGQANGREVFGIPAWALRAFCQEQLKRLVATVTFSPVEQRMKILMRISYMKGIIHGAIMQRQEQRAGR